MASAAPSGSGPAQAQPAPAPPQKPQDGSEAQIPAGNGRPVDPISDTEATGKDGLELTRSKTLKPIRLPGVMEDGPEDARERQETQDSRQRDDRGRFVAKTDPAQAPGETAEGKPPRPDAAPEPPVDPNAPKKYTFAGREYTNQSEAEQRHRSLEGQFKPLTEKVRAMEETAHTAAHSANAWKARADQLEAELASVREGGGPQSQPAGTQEPAGDPADSIDWELYAEIRKRYDEMGEPWRAEAWLQQKQQAIWDKKQEALREELTRPFREAEARKQVAAQTDQLFSSLAEYVNSDGSPSFPELRDPEAAYMVGRFWTSMGLPTDYALTPQGAIAAVAMYRMAGGKTAASLIAPVSQGSPTPAPPAPPSDAAAAASLAGGRPDVTPTAPATPGTPEEAFAAGIKSRLRKTELTRKGLGFAE
jgi:hypothetical protein